MESHVLTEIRRRFDGYSTSMKPLELPEAGLQLEPDGRDDVRLFKHIHWMCVLHLEHFRRSSQMQHIYILKALLDAVEATNHLSLAAAARAALEFNAFVYTVLTKLRTACCQEDKRWRTKGEEFFAVILRARFGTAIRSVAERLMAGGLPAAAAKPMNITRCLETLQERRPGAGGRYAQLCDFVHHNLSSRSALTRGSAQRQVAKIGDGGIINLTPGGVITRYEFPSHKWALLLEEVGEEFVKDVDDSAFWLARLPNGPFRPELVLAKTGTIFGFDQGKQPGPWSR